MSKSKMGWFAILAILYGSFWVWYGGNGDPLSEAEGEKMLRKMEQAYGVDSNELPQGHFLRNMKEMIPNDDGKEFYAVNLETLKKDAAGRMADAKYANVVFPLLFERAGHPVFVSERVGLMLGRYGNEIDRTAVVRYRSLQDLIAMVSDPRFVKGEKFKSASLEHTEVFITRPTITFLQVRMFVGLLLFLLGIAGWKFIGWISIRRKNAGANAGTKE